MDSICPTEADNDAHVECIVEIKEEPDEQAVDVDDAEESEEASRTQPVNPEMCGYCLRIFDSAEELVEHLEKDHETLDNSTDGANTEQGDEAASSIISVANATQTPVARRQICGYCLECFTFENELLEHLKEHKEHEPERSVSTNCRSQNDEKRYECKACRKRFRNELALVYHECHKASSTSFPSWHVRKLGKRYAPSSKVNISEAQKTYQCDICNNLFGSELGLRKHKWTHEKRYECHICYKTFAGSGVLKNHLVSHTGEKHFQCEICQKRFSRKGCLSVHLQLHKSTRKRSALCEVCGKQFLCVADLKVHYGTHEGKVERRFECHVCNKRFVTATPLTRHMRKHTKERPFKCNICQKSFSAQYSVGIHMRIHTGEMPFQCSFCETRFRFRAVLKQHERIHTGEKPYKCQHCEKCFRVASSLSQHVLTHKK